MHILTELKVSLGPVLEDAANDHFSCTGVKIKYFILPTLQFEKLRREPGFLMTGISYIGEWNEFIIIKNHTSQKCEMREEKDTHHYPVYYFEGE